MNRQTTDPDIDNPQYWTDRAAQLTSDEAEEAAYRQTPAGQLERAERRLAALEADSGIQIPATLAAQRALVDQLRADITAGEDARFAAEWTREITIARRADWNARVNAGEFARNGKIWPPLVDAQERAQGWDRQALKRAIELYGLK